MKITNLTGKYSTFLCSIILQLCWSLFVFMFHFNILVPSVKRGVGCFPGTSGTIGDTYSSHTWLYLGRPGSLGVGCSPGITCTIAITGARGITGATGTTNITDTWL